MAQCHSVKMLQSGPSGCLKNTEVLKYIMTISPGPICGLFSAEESFGSTCNCSNSPSCGIKRSQHRLITDYRRFIVQSIYHII